VGVRFHHFLTSALQGDEAALALSRSHIEFHFENSIILQCKDIDGDNNYELILSGVINCEKSIFLVQCLYFCFYKVIG
jgi:hypothetical protein